MDYDEMEISSTQKEILEKFRTNLQDILTTDHTDAELLKWLRANNFGLKKAERNFREVDACRKTLRFNTVTETYVMPEVIQKYNRPGFLGFAKDGSTIRYYALHIDNMGFAHSITLYDIFEYFIYNMESDLKKLKEQTEKTGRNPSKITFILDFEEFSVKDILHQCVLDAGLEIFSKFQEYYPETWSNYFFVNASYIADKVLMLFKPVFNSSLLNSIHIASKSSTGSLLKKYIDEDLLPAFLGGSRVDSNGDPNCREIINGYRKIPEEYYLKNTIHFIDETVPGVKVIIIRPWSVFNVPVIVKEIGTKMRVETRTENGSIHFSVLHRNFPLDPEKIKMPESNEKLDPDDENSNLRRVVPRIKCHTDIAPFNVTLFAYCTGIYIFYFENTSSWFESRKLFYRITVFPPDSTE